MYGHPGFVRVVARASGQDPRPLLVTATDLGRAADGTWRVVADRTEAPSGIGYARENRRVVSRVLPVGSDDMNLPLTMLLLDARLLPPKAEFNVDALLPHSKLQVGPRARKGDESGVSGPALRRSIAQRLRKSARHTALSLASLLHV